MQSSSSLWVMAPGSTTVAPGIGRVYVNAGGAVTLTLPPNDVLVMDRGPQAGTFPITVQPPGGTTIDGQPSYVLIGDWAIGDFIFDGTNFGIVA